MCRHLLPRFDLHPAHALHQAAEWIGLHPTTAALIGAAFTLSAIGTSAFSATGRSLAARPRRLVRRAWIDGSTSLRMPTRLPGRG